MPWTPPPQDELAACLAALGRGDVAALGVLYRREAAAVYRYALALSGDAHLADDATQEAFIALAARPAGFDTGQGSLGAYLAGIARHHLLAQWRRQARDVAEHAAVAEGADDGLVEALAWDGPSPEQQLVQRQRIEGLRVALAQLSWPQREAVVLVDLQGRPYAEAAAIAGCELNTLRTRLHRGRAELAKRLQGEHGGCV